MNKILARSVVYAKVGELVNGKLTPSEHVIIPGISSKHFKTKTFIYHTDGKVNFSVREFVFPAIYIYLKLSQGASVEDISREELKDVARIKSFIYDNLNHVSIIQNTNIPEGKGLAATSADILSVLLALNKFFGTRFDKRKMYEICSMVVPTDPLLDKEIDLMFSPEEGRKVFNLIPRRFGVVYFDSDENTSFNAQEFYDRVEYGAEDYAEYNSILELYQNGCVLNKPEFIYEATTRSAELNQRHAPKKHFEKLKAFAQKHNIGVFAGHTGSVLGLLMDAQQMEEIIQEATGFIEATWNSKVYAEACEASVLRFH